MSLVVAANKEYNISEWMETKVGVSDICASLNGMFSVVCMLLLVCKMRLCFESFEIVYVLVQQDSSIPINIIFMNCLYTRNLPSFVHRSFMHMNYFQWKVLHFNCFDLRQTKSSPHHDGKQTNCSEFHLLN